MRYPPTKMGPTPPSVGPNDPTPISKKAAESYGDATTGAGPKSRCAALTRDGHRCQNWATIGPVCKVHEEHSDRLPEDIRRAVRRARKRKLAKWFRQRASNPPLLSRAELEVLLDHTLRGAERAAEYIGRPEYDDLTLDVQRRGIVRDAIVDGLQQVAQRRRDRSGMLRLVEGGGK